MAGACLPDTVHRMINNNNVEEEFGMAAILTVENVFQQQDINVRKQLFNECLAHIISDEENDNEVLFWTEKIA